MSHKTGRHSNRTAKAIPVQQFLRPAADITATSHRSGAATVAPSLRFPNAAVALTAATALAFTPLALHPPGPHPALPSVSVPAIHLDASTTAQQIQSLQDAVNSQLNALDTTVATIVGVPGQTLSTVLSSAASLNSNFWQTLITASAASPLLTGALKALQTVSSGGLTQLAATLTSANTDLTLSTQQTTNLLTSTITGSAAVALTAFAGIAANPLSLSSFVGLLDTPFTLAGGVLSNIIAAADHLGANVISLGGTLVTGVTGQISNIVAAIDTLLSGAKGSINNNVVDGLITAVQGVVAAPLQAILSGVNGVTTAITGGATSVLNVVATAAENITHTWLGNGSTNGAIQNIINTIGSAPLSVESWVSALTTATQAAITTVTGTATTLVAGMAPIPFTVSSALVNAGASAVTAFTNGVAEIAAGLLTAVGVPSLLTNTVYGMAGAFNTGINVAATAVTAALNTVATLIGAATSITGIYSPAAAVPAAAAKTVALSTTPVAAATPGAATTLKTSAGKTASVPVAATTAAPTSVATATKTAPATSATSTTAKDTTTSKASSTADTGKPSHTTETTSTKDTTSGSATASNSVTGATGGKHSKPDPDNSTSSPAKAVTTGPATAANTSGKHTAPSTTDAAARPSHAVSPK